MSKIKPLHIDVRGSHGIDFREGSKTGDMEEYGVSIDTVYHSGRGIFGGCINRKEATQIRDFLNECIAKWESENDE